MEQKFYYCKICGKIITLLNNPGPPTVCCGKEMVEMVAGTVDASKEKHVPEVKVNGNKVEVAVGAVLHPMTDEHYIEFIYLQTEKSGQAHLLKPGDEPKAVFCVAEGDKAVSVFEHCNLHGLWKTDL